VQKVNTSKPSAQLIVAQTIPYANYTDAIVQYNDYISNTLVPYYSGLGYNVSTVDQYSHFLTDGVIDPTLYSNAINHPSPEGYERMAQSWYDGIESLGEITHTALPVIHTMTDENLLSGRTAVASSVYGGSFSPSYVTDGTANQQVFFGTADGGSDSDMRLVIHDIDSEEGLDVIRIWRDMNDTNRQPGQVSIRCSANDTASLEAASYETELASLLSLDFGMEEYVDILVNAPAGTQSLFLDFGGVDSNGSAYGLRIPEVQAFAMPEPATITILLSGLVYGYRRRGKRR